MSASAATTFNGRPSGQHHAEGHGSAARDETLDYTTENCKPYEPYQTPSKGLKQFTNIFAILTTHHNGFLTVLIFVSSRQDF